jgi:hypothetical protein
MAGMTVIEERTERLLTQKMAAMRDLVQHGADAWAASKEVRELEDQMRPSRYTWLLPARIGARAFCRWPRPGPAWRCCKGRASTALIVEHAASALFRDVPVSSEREENAQPVSATFSRCSDHRKAKEPTLRCFTSRKHSKRSVKQHGPQNGQC